MARSFIQIDSIDDIDLSRVSVGNINDRYIDKEGNRYATRFNLRTRKIDIIRIALGNDEALHARMKHRSSGQKKDAEDESIPAAPLSGGVSVPDWVTRAAIQPDESIDNQSFLNSLDQESSKISERIRGIISNMKNSEAFEGAARSSGNTVEDVILKLTTMYDREVQENLNQTQNLVSEFNRFPKPPSNYYIHLSRKQKLVVEGMSEDKQMDYFKAFMIGSVFLKALEGSFSIIDKSREAAKKVKPASLSHEKRMFFNNGVEACDIVETNLREITASAYGWMKNCGIF